jgi:hypothetical protein|tara:strand:- start:195 stop:488 length:294 start_codon:yes stop_codon:yes gene_type:complete
MTKKSGSDNSCGIVGVVLGIVSVVFGLFVPPFGTMVLGIVGLIFSLKQKKVSKNKWSKYGIVLNIAGIVISVLVLAAITYVQNNPELFNQIVQGTTN